MAIEKKIIVILALIYLITGISGIKWGLPSSYLNKIYFYQSSSLEQNLNDIEFSHGKLPRYTYNPIRSYHPDEYFIIKTLQSINLPSLKFSIGQFSIGGVYLYMYGFLLFILSFTGLVHLNKDITYYFLHPEEIAKFYLTGRIICLIYGLGIVLLTYIITRKISKNRTAPFIASIILIFSPLFLLNSHYMYVDIPGTFWIMLSLYLSIRYCQDKWKSGPLIIGLFTGLAAGTKITFILSFFISILAILLTEKKIQDLFKQFTLTFCGFLFSFVLFNPFCFFALKELFFGTGQGSVAFSFTPLFYILSLKYGLGLLLFVFLFIGIIFSGQKIFERERILILLWGLFFFFVLSSCSGKFARYILPIVPLFIILGIDFWFSYSKINLVKFLKKGILSLVLISTFIYGMAFEMLFIKENIRTEAGVWIKENIPAGSSIGVTEVPWQFQMPPFDYYVYKVEVTGYDIESLKETQPDYFILSSFQAPIPPYPLKLQKERINFYKEFIATGMYTEEMRFEKYPSLGFISFRFKTLPEDLIYLNPSIVIYRKVIYNN
ncbi:MAG: glycosyltransferase family 39 protein [bacterium]|nr:glycosyltransferase family 39 protein [bacterium]